ncbi:MAG TPA: ABC transporter permease [Actinomycetota bacterium]|jgi:spermidine/putrescine transport system permease protein|nr:ABC transporter permease [Actinomycetota bacterium]
MSDTVVRAPEIEAPRLRTRGVRGWWKDPFRKPRILSAFTWAYLAWSILPVLVAIGLSFNAGRSNTQLQTLGLRWWVSDPDREGLFQDPELRAAIMQTYRLSLLTMLIAVPLGVAFAIGIDRWRGRLAKGASFMMLLTFVMPEIIIGVAMQLVFQHLLKAVHLGTTAQVLGLVTYQISYPVIIVRARLLSIGKEYEEAGMDLGATPRQSIRRVLLPLLYPAIFASFAIVFADTVDDFVTVRYLSGQSSTEPLAIKIYAVARASPTPAVNAAATFMLITTTIVIALGYAAYKRANRGQAGGDVSALTQI